MVLLAACAGLAACSADDEPPERPTSRVTLLVGNAEVLLGCPPVKVARLSRQGIAFSGTIRPVGDPAVEDVVDWAVDVDHWYTGGDEDEVVVHGSSVSIGYWFMTTAGTIDPDVPGTAPEEGDRVLVAGRTTRRGPREEGGVEIVGFADACLTRVWDTDLADRYERAFPTPAPRPTRRG